MAITPTSYDPAFWSNARFRSLDLYAGVAVEDAGTVSRLLVEYFRHSPEQPTHFSYQVVGARQRKLKTKTIDKILEKLDPVEGRLESMYVEAIRDEDHTHAVASLGYNYFNIFREYSRFGAHCFQEDFDFQTARLLAMKVAEVVQLDYGFSSLQVGIMNACGFGSFLRIDRDPFSAKRERWMTDFDRKQPRPSNVPFLNVFELNVLSEIHLATTIAGRSFEAYVRDKGRGTLERIGKANFMWCLDESDMAKAKADLAEQGLVAMV